jgi:hypothetical protein
MPPAQIARHSGVLLAELDRVVRALDARNDEARALHLAQLFDAAERAGGPDALGRVGRTG